MTDRQTLLSLCSENEFMEHVIGYARLQHWKIAHFRPARTARGWRTAMQGDEGFQDLVMARERVIFAELKSAKGKESLVQRAWRETLLAAGAEVYLWFPKDWDEVMRILE